MIATAEEKTITDTEYKSPTDYQLDLWQAAWASLYVIWNDYIWLKKINIFIMFRIITEITVYASCTIP